VTEDFRGRAGFERGWRLDARTEGVRFNIGGNGSLVFASGPFKDS